MSITVLFDEKYHHAKLSDEEKRITFEGAKQGLTRRQIASLLKTNYRTLVANPEFKDLYNGTLAEKIKKIAAKAFELAEAGSESMIRYILDRKGKWNRNEDDILPSDFYTQDYHEKCETLDRLRSENLLSEEGYKAVSKILTERYRYITVDEQREHTENLAKQILDMQSKEKINEKTYNRA